MTVQSLRVVGHLDSESARPGSATPRLKLRWARSPKHVGQPSIQGLVDFRVEVCRFGSGTLGERTVGFFKPGLVVWVWWADDEDEEPDPADGLGGVQTQS